MLFAAAGLLVLAAALPFAARQYVASGLTVRVHSATLEKMPGAGPSDTKDLHRWLANKTLHVRLVLHNRTRLPFAIDAVDYMIVVYGAEALSGQGRKSVDLPPGTDRTIDWRLPLADPSFRRMLVQPPEGGVPSDLHATVQFRVAGVSWQTTFHQRVLLRPILEQ